MEETGAEKKARLLALREDWLRQRANDQDRRAVHREMVLESSVLSNVSPPSSSSSAVSSSVSFSALSPMLDASAVDPRAPPSASSAASSSSVSQELVLERITDRLATRLREELKVELMKESEKEALKTSHINAKMESHLAAELEQHCCGICLELMSTQERSPILLFPCGHTFCEYCLKQHAKKSLKENLCPFCRQKITSQAPNLPLKQLIQSFMQKKEKLKSEPLSEASSMSSPSRARIRNDDNGQGGGESAAEDYFRQFRTLKMRVRILGNELSDTGFEAEQLKKKESTAKVVLQALESEEKKIDEKIELLLQELQIVQAQVKEQSSKVRVLEEERKHVDQKHDLVKNTLENLRRDRDKTRLILEELGPDLLAHEDEDD